HDIGIGLKPDVPDVLGDFRTRYDFAGRTNQMCEEEKFLWREIERHARTNGLVPLQINLQIIDAQMFLVLRGSASQQRAHPGQQLRKREGLYQIIVRAQLESFHAVAHAVASGKEKNR